LHRQYHLDSTGWGTPFLLVPEATTVDEATLELLSAAKEKDVVLSHNSPLGVRFHYLKGTTSEKEKYDRIENGKPGSPCTEKHLAFNTEFTTEPVCTASQKYIRLKLEQLRSMDLPEAELNRQVNEVLDKECLCQGLSNAAAIQYNQVFVKNFNAVTICPGPNIAYFSKQVSLQTMTDHIYGRTNILSPGIRPHMFIKELSLYINYLREQLNLEIPEGELLKKKKYFQGFYQNLTEGIAYYRNLPELVDDNDGQFEKGLNQAVQELESMNRQYAIQDIQSCLKEKLIPQ
jgi:hypothetical protein